MHSTPDYLLLSMFVFLLIWLQFPCMHSFTICNLLKGFDSKPRVGSSISKTHLQEDDEAFFMRRETRRKLLEETRNAILTTMVFQPPAFAVDDHTIDSTTRKVRDGETLCQEVSRWYKGDQNLWLIGTAHISSQSASLTGRVVREVKVISLTRIFFTSTQ